ncbi:MAG TPA: Cof-type HAD-IIB family hydrolase [Vicinamibacterales bacterium]|nr:Cof-type HAD-IIB family hydrolase [Vicinamibacterales bacterium]
MAHEPSAETDGPIAALLADVDGTLITKEKVLTARTVDAVKRLRERGVVFCVTSGRPPRGLRMFVEPLELTIAMAGFNGGVIVHPDLSIIDEKPLPVDLPTPVIDTMHAHGLDVWVYSPTDWYVTDPQGTRVDRETSTIQFRPVVVPNYDALLHEVIKIVGTSTDYDAVARCEASVHAQFGTRVTAARSQPYYLDVTHPEANKGAIVRRLARYLNVSPRRIATIGDQLNDTVMFKESGLSIAMGNASAEVQRQATFVTTSFGDEGFANAVERFVLPRTQLTKATSSRTGTP